MFGVKNLSCSLLPIFDINDTATSHGKGRQQAIKEAKSDQFQIKLQKGTKQLRPKGLDLVFFFCYISFQNCQSTLKYQMKDS